MFTKRSYNNCFFFHVQVNVFIQLFRPSDNDISDPVPFRYKPRSNYVFGKRQRKDSEYNSVDFLPTVIDEKMATDTISKEYNKSGMIQDLYNENAFSCYSDSDAYGRFMEMVDSKSHGTL